MIFHAYTFVFSLIVKQNREMKTYESQTKPISILYFLLAENLSKLLLPINFISSFLTEKFNLDYM